MATEQTKEQAAVTASAPKIPLPQFYDGGMLAILKEAQRLDPEHRHRMVKVGPTNETQKLFRGWVPLEDKAVIEKIGLKSLMSSANGRVRYMDSELWRMPTSVALAIRERINAKTAARHGQLAEQLNAMKEEIGGRTKGKVEVLTGDVLDKGSLVSK